VAADDGGRQRVGNLGTAQGAPWISMQARCGVGSGNGLGNEIVDEFVKIYNVFGLPGLWASGMDDWRLLDWASSMYFGPIGMFGLF
jgi:hypothetical protein